MEVKRMKQSEIRNLVAMDIAKDVTFESAEFFESHNFEVLNVSMGYYGANGALLRDRDTRELYAITSAKSTLYYVI